MKMLLMVSLFLSLAASAKPAHPLAHFEELEGTWSIYVGDKKTSTKMTYERASKNSIVVEKFGNEVSVFSRDGNALLMTHFCNSGHQSRLRLKSAEDSKHYIFESFEQHNLVKTLKNNKSEVGQNASYIKRIEYRFVAADRMLLDIVWFDGKTEETESYRLTRSSEKAKHSPDKP